MILTRIIVPIIDECELALAEEVDEVTTLVPNDTHDDGANQIGPNVIGMTMDPTEDVANAPSQVPNDPPNDGGNSCH